MAQKLINSLKFGDGNEYIIGIPTISTSISGGVINIAEDDLVLEEGAMFTYVAHCTGTGISVFDISSLTSISVGSTSKPVIYGGAVTKFSGPVTFVYSGGKWRIVEDHSHTINVPNVPDHIYTPAGTVGAKFTGNSATITSSAPSGSTAVINSASLTLGSFKANVPTKVSSSKSTAVTGITETTGSFVTSVSIASSGTAVTSITETTGSFVTGVSLSATSSTVTVVTGVSLTPSDASETNVLRSVSISASVSSKCLTLSLTPSTTSVVNDAKTYTITKQTKDVTIYSSGTLTVKNGSALTDITPQTANFAKTLNVETGSALTDITPQTANFAKTLTVKTGSALTDITPETASFAKTLTVKNGSALTDITPQTANFIDTVTVTSGTAAECEFPSITSTTTNVATSGHTHTTTHTPTGTVSATFTGTQATLQHDVSVS